MGFVESKHTGDSEDVQRHDCGGATVVAKLSKIRKWKEVKDSCLERSKLESERRPVKGGWGEVKSAIETC